jgi:hypothetical protein
MVGTEVAFVEEQGERTAGQHGWASLSPFVRSRMAATA